METTHLTDAEMFAADKARPLTDAEMFAKDESRPLTDAEMFAGESPKGLTDEEMFAAQEQRPAPPSQELEDSITPEKLAEIAKARGVNPADLEAVVPYFNMSVEGKGMGGLPRAAGLVSEAYGGVGTKLYRMMQNPAMEAALDDVAEYAQQHKSWSAIGAEAVTGLALPLGPVGKLAKVAAAGKGALAAGAITGTLMGGAEGFGRSRSGEELGSAATFGALGGVAGGVLGKGFQTIAGNLGIARTNVVKKLGGIEGLGLNKVEREEAQRLINEEVVKLKGQSPGMAESIPLNAVKGRHVDLDVPVASPEHIAAVAKKIAEGKIPQRTLDIHAKNGIVGEAAAAKVASAEIAADTRDFARYLTGKKLITDSHIRGAFEKNMQKGQDFLANEYNNFLQTKALHNLIKEDVIKKAPGVKNWLRQATLFIIDGKYAHRLIDDRLGTNLEVALDDFTSKKNIFTEDLHQTLSDPAYQAAGALLKKAGPGVEESFYNALDKGARNTVAPELLPAYDTFRRLFDERGKKAIKDGLNLTMRANYVPYKIQDTVKLMQSIEAQIEKLAPPLKNAIRSQNITPEVLTALKADPVGERLVQAVAVLNGTKPSATASHFAKKLAGVLDPRMLGEKVETFAKAAFMREGDIPDFIKEKNVAALYSMWNQDTFRHLASRDIISEMKLAAKKAMLMGEKDDADYILNHMKDLLGVRRGTAASWFKDQRLAFTVAMTKAAAKDTLLSPLYAQLAKAPEIMPTLFNQMYPNFLGLSPRAALVNAFQPLMMTVPELGYSYGIPKLAGAYKDIASILANKASGKVELSPAMAARLGKKPGDVVDTNSLITMLKGAGRTPTQFQAELMDSLSGGIRQGSLGGTASKGLEKWNDFAMSAFTGSETVNRMVASMAGLGVAQDLLGHSGAKLQSAAKSFVERMGSGYRRTIVEAMGRGTDEGNKRVAELLQNYMISKTIFNYNRATMSQYGRSMGPMLSAFTKWPLSIAGDIVQNFTRGENAGQKLMGGASKTGLKYLAPLAMLYAANEAFVKPVMDEQEWANRLLGSRGLVGLAPVGAIADVVSGELKAPPVVSVLRGLGMGITTGDATQLWKSFNDGIAGFTPVVPALADSLIGLSAAVANEPKPKGTFIGKIAQAAGATNPDEVVRDFTQDIKDTLFGD